MVEACHGQCGAGGVRRRSSARRWDPVRHEAFWSSQSPFVRKVIVTAHQTRLVSVSCVSRPIVAPANPNAKVIALNPLDSCNAAAG